MIIATRSLTLRTLEGDVEIPIRMFAPEKDGNAWKCRFCSAESRAGVTAFRFQKLCATC